MRSLTCKGKMQKLYVICLLICIPIIQQVTARKSKGPPLSYYEQFRINYTDHDTYFQDIDYLEPNGHIIYRLSKNDTHIFINKTDHDKNNAITELRCVMELKGLNDGFQVTLNNKKIILWGVQTNSFNVVGVTLLSIDPRNCNCTSLNVPADVIPENHSPYQPQVLTYIDQDYFDIFYGGRQACMPCRFTNEGEKIDMTNKQITNIADQIARPYLIRRYLEGKNISYLLIYSYYNETLRTAVNKLDSNFHLVEQRFVDHFIDAVAIGQRGIEVCYKQEYQRKVQETEVYCDHYLTNLRRERHERLDIPRLEYVNGIDMSVSHSGSLCVAVPHISYENKGNKYSMSWFRFSYWDGYDRSYPSIERIEDIDDESAYHLKFITSKRIREHCE